MMIEMTQKDANDAGGTSISSAVSSITPSKPAPWLKRTRIIAVAVYILLLLAYMIFIIVCIARYPRCTAAPKTPWWMNSLFLRVSSSKLKFNDVLRQIDGYQTNFSAQGLWIPTILPSSEERNPIDWKPMDEDSNKDQDLIALIEKAHEYDLRLITDYPVNHFSIQSPVFLKQDDSYFVWNDQGNSSNWISLNNSERSAWIYNSRKNSFYLSQLNNNDAIDVNFRNNRVLNDFLASFSYWQKKFSLDGFNVQGISYAYEDYEYRNNSETQFDRTRHLEEDYFLLRRMQQELSPNQILLLDAIESLATANESALERYYHNAQMNLNGVQMASMHQYTVVDELQRDVSGLFDRYAKSIFFKNHHPLLWSSRSSNAQLNEAFFAACLFHIGAISIDVDHEGQYFSSSQLDRLRQLFKTVRSLAVFRDGSLEQKIYSDKQWLTVERARRGSRHHMIIVNFSSDEQEQQIELTGGITSAVEVFLSNIANPGTRYETNALIDMNKPIQLKSYEYLVLRWSAAIDGLGIIF